MLELLHSGTPLIRTLLRPSSGGRIIVVFSFQGLLIWHECSYCYFQWCNVTCDLKVYHMDATSSIERWCLHTHSSLCCAEKLPRPSYPPWERLVQDGSSHLTSEWHPDCMLRWTGRSGKTKVIVQVLSIYYTQVHSVSYRGGRGKQYVPPSPPPPGD